MGSYGYKIESLFKRSVGELVFERKAWDPRRVWNELEGRGVAQSGRWRPQECLMPSGDKDRQKLLGMDFPLRYILSKLLARTWQVCHLCTELFPPTTLSASKQSPLLEQGWSDAETKGQREKKKKPIPSLVRVDLKVFIHGHLCLVLLKELVLSFTTWMFSTWDSWVTGKRRVYFKNYNSSTCSGNIAFKNNKACWCRCWGSLALVRGVLLVKGVPLEGVTVNVEKLKQSKARLGGAFNKLSQGEITCGRWSGETSPSPPCSIHFGFDSWNWQQEGISGRRMGCSCVSNNLCSW